MWKVQVSQPKEDQLLLLIIIPILLVRHLSEVTKIIITTWGMVRCPAKFSLQNNLFFYIFRIWFNLQKLPVLLSMNIHSLTQSTSHFGLLYLVLPWKQKFTLIPKSAFQITLKISLEDNTPLFHFWIKPQLLHISSEFVALWFFGPCFYSPVPSSVTKVPWTKPEGKMG